MPLAAAAGGVVGVDAPGDSDFNGGNGRGHKARGFSGRPRPKGKWMSSETRGPFGATGCGDAARIAGPLFLTAALALLLAGCAPERAEVSGKALYLEHCAACHGPAGAGDGPLAPDLDPRPADLTAIARRAGGVFDHVRVMSVIDGYKNPERQMPEFGNLLPQSDMVLVDTGDGVLTPTPVPLVALADYLAAIQVP